MPKSANLLGATLMAAALLGAGFAARAEEPNPAAEATVDIAPDAAPADSAPAVHRGGSRWLTDEEEARLRVAGEQARLAAQSASERMKIQAEAIKSAAEQLKPTPEQKARLRAMVDEQTALARQQYEAAIERQIDALQKQLDSLRHSRQD